MSAQVQERKRQLLASKEERLKREIAEHERWEQEHKQQLVERKYRRRVTDREARKAGLQLDLAPLNENDAAASDAQAHEQQAMKARLALEELRWNARERERKEHERQEKERAFRQKYQEHEKEREALLARRAQSAKVKASPSRDWSATPYAIAGVVVAGALAWAVFGRKSATLEPVADALDIRAPASDASLKGYKLSASEQSSLRTALQKYALQQAGALSADSMTLSAIASPDVTPTLNGATSLQAVLDAGLTPLVSPGVYRNWIASGSLAPRFLIAIARGPTLTQAIANGYVALG